MNEQPQAVSATTMTRGVARPAAVLIALFLLLVWPLILMEARGTNEAFDQDRYHLPVIRAFAESWPAVNLREYDSATTPGFHLAIATVMQVTGDRPMLLRLVASIASLILIVIVWWTVARGVRDPWVALAFTLPLLCSSYVIGSAAWLTTDNVGLLFPVLIIGAALSVGITPRRASCWSMWAMLAVFVRQIHLWSITPIVLTALLRSPPLAWRFGRSAWSWRAVLLVCASTAAPVALVGAFIWTWGGLTPPTFAAQHGAGANPAFMVLTLALIGVFGWLPLAILLVREPEARKGLLRPTMLVVAATGLLAVIPPTSFDRAAGRWGGVLWEVNRHLPVVMERSPLLILLAMMGGVVLLAFTRCAIASARRETLILLISFLGWMLAQTTNAQAWQRYAEPMVLILLAWLTMLAVRDHARARRAMAIAWLIVAAGQLALSAYTVYYEAFTGSAAGP